MNRLAVSIAEAAEALGVSASHAQNLAKAGTIPTIRLGRRRVVPVVWLEEQVAKALDGAA